MPLNPEKELRQAAAVGNLDKIKALVYSNPDLNINASGPESGRAAIHWAAVKGQNQALRLLIALGADRDCKDKAEFTPLDLVINPIKFTGKVSKHIFEDRFKQIENLQQDFQDNNCSIVYVRNISEMENHITQNPHLNKIGFIIDTPNILKATTETVHVVPIFLERKGPIEKFIILDSAYVRFIPIKIKKGIKREIFFNPFARQASGDGCFREAILTLIHCFFDKKLSNFCMINSNPINISKHPTEEERSIIKGNSKTADEMLIGAKIVARLNFEKKCR